MHRNMRRNNKINNDVADINTYIVLFQGSDNRLLKIQQNTVG